jgi:DNA (cytosine-5)-methyltransferase 1
MPKFLDLFAGCGGLSLGLTNAGWTGRFAIEKHPDAFRTLEANLLTGSRKSFEWPRWLERKAWSIQSLISKHSVELAAMKGSIDLIAGGPPCQGYSTAGRRNPHDNRNKLVSQYLQLVKLVEPRFLILENVTGFTSGFEEREVDGKKRRGRAASEMLVASLRALDYHVSSALINCADWGVPQRRTRFIALAVHKNFKNSSLLPDLIEQLKSERVSFLKARGLPEQRHVTAREAIDDLATVGRTLEVDPEHSNFLRLAYSPPEISSSYLSCMRDGADDRAPNSLRLPNHRQKTLDRFGMILESSERGKTLSLTERERFGLKKHTFIPLSPDRPSPTVTTLPDDMMHYAEPRILTVREMARLQSFPDWFDFHGKYTTGGPNRAIDCPRYTQVGNAVPPLLAEALGQTIASLLRQRRDASTEAASAS